MVVGADPPLRNAPIGRALVPITSAPVPVISAPKTLANSPLAKLIGDVDVYDLSPRRMAEISLDLYAAGIVSFDDYSVLAFQAELHPDFDRTIGALTGEKAAPDRRRNFVRVWEDRAAFARRHDAQHRDLVEQSERIAAVLRLIDQPTNVVI